MKIHVVQSGDTLTELAQKYNVPIDRILEANPTVTDREQLQFGIKVRIPTGRVPVVSNKKEEGGDFTPDNNTNENMHTIDDQMSYAKEIDSPYFDNYNQSYNQAYNQNYSYNFQGNKDYIESKNFGPFPEPPQPTYPYHSGLSQPYYPMYYSYSPMPAYYPTQPITPSVHTSQESSSMIDSSYSDLSDYVKPASMKDTYPGSPSPGMYEGHIYNPYTSNWGAPAMPTDNWNNQLYTSSWGMTPPTTPLWNSTPYTPYPETQSSTQWTSPTQPNISNWESTPGQPCSCDENWSTDPWNNQAYVAGEPSSTPPWNPQPYAASDSATMAPPWNPQPYAASASSSGPWNPQPYPASGTATMTPPWNPQPYAASGTASSSMPWNPQPYAASGTASTTPPWNPQPYAASGTASTTPPWNPQPYVANGAKATTPPWNGQPYVGDGTEATTPPWNSQPHIANWDSNQKMDTSNYSQPYSWAQHNWGGMPYDPSTSYSPPGYGMEYMYPNTSGFYNYSQMAPPFTFHPMNQNEANVADFNNSGQTELDNEVSIYINKESSSREG